MKFICSKNREFCFRYVFQLIIKAVEAVLKDIFNHKGRKAHLRKATVGNTGAKDTKAIL